MKKIIVVGSRNFECHFNSLGKSMIEVNIWEIKRSTWKIFRCAYRNSYCFFDTDYPTIMDGVKAMVNRYLAEEQEETARANKWKELEEG